jgi:TM2 domain-containing membrane protein YozV
MANPATDKVPPPENGPTAALLSYLVPGLGQIYQGRVGKGVLFFACVYALFFYGLYLGSWKNVFFLNRASDSAGFAAHFGGETSLLRRLVDRPHFAGQFFVGVAAWPAIYQAWVYDPKQDDSPPLKGFMRVPSDEEMQRLQREGDKTWDLAWVYTVIAGVLNVMVIYDAFAGPAFVVRPGRKEESQPHAAAPAASS